MNRSLFIIALYFLSMEQSFAQSEITCSFSSAFFSDLLSKDYMFERATYGFTGLNHKKRLTQKKYAPVVFYSKTGILYNRSGNTYWGFAPGRKASYYTSNNVRSAGSTFVQNLVTIPIGLEIRFLREPLTKPDESFLYLRGSLNCSYLVSSSLRNEIQTSSMFSADTLQQHQHIQTMARSRFVLGGNLEAAAYLGINLLNRRIFIHTGVFFQRVSYPGIKEKILLAEKYESPFSAMMLRGGAYTDLYVYAGLELSLNPIKK